jgi:hypothetical protein
MAISRLERLHQLEDEKRNQYANTSPNGVAATAYQRAKAQQAPASSTSTYVPPTTQKPITPYVLPKYTAPDPALDPYGVQQAGGGNPVTANVKPMGTSTPTPPVGGGGSGGAPIVGGGSGGTGGGTAPAAPTQGSKYSGMSPEEYRSTLIESVKNGILTAYEANINIIRNNLTKALSDLDAEEAALQPIYQEQLKGIQDRKFATTVQQTELMNQAGWNATNSGLAVGEHTRIANQASEETNDANTAFNAAVADIMRRRTLTTQLADSDLSSAEQQKNYMLAEAEASAMIEAENRNRQIFESDRDFEEGVRQWTENFNLNQKEFDFTVNKYWQDRSDDMYKYETSRADANARAASSSGGAVGYEKWELDELTTVTFSEIMSSKDPNATLREILQDDELPAEVKENILDLMQKNKNVSSTSPLGGITLNTDTTLSTPKKASGQVQ